MLRGFLLAGGLALLGLGLVRGVLFNVALGSVAALLGGFGLWWELFHEPSQTEPAE